MTEIKHAQKKKKKENLRYTTPKKAKKRGGGGTTQYTDRSDTTVLCFLFLAYL